MEKLSSIIPVGQEKSPVGTEGFPLTSMLRQLSQVDSLSQPFETSQNTKTGPRSYHFSIPPSPDHPPVEFAIVVFVNHVLAFITDSGKITTLIEAFTEDSENEIYGHRILLGDRNNTFFPLLARSFIQSMNQICDKNLILAISLKVIDSKLYEKITALFKIEFIAKERAGN
ncbi:hypothetical protein IE077_002210 [Cardiosporidium cionae]|uniref:Proteasome assembly chaperone 3 n=1 Tax=Cardiosporidium cionae TaxID=476202 RepID=A0ABQ7JBF8_9APIC|nr:hypothetical protein IE077_002210 [Cardiosporidium cionae]|eukprot:KAF8821280.1 hypothetical protein IE077_002210 [Cardiosporidium cionae]